MLLPAFVALNTSNHNRGWQVILARQLMGRACEGCGIVMARKTGLSLLHDFTFGVICAIGYREDYKEKANRNRKHIPI
jgi:hypothetical protein